MVTGAPFASATTALTCCMYELLQAGVSNHLTPAVGNAVRPASLAGDGPCWSHIEQVSISDRDPPSDDSSISDRAHFVTDLRGSPTAGLAALDPPSDHSSISDRAHFVTDLRGSPTAGLA